MIAAGVVMIFAAIALACQHVWWAGREQKTRAAHRDQIKQMDREWAADIREATEATSAATRRASVAELAVEELANDLAAERRGKQLLYATVLDAQRERDQLAEVVNLPMRRESGR